MFHFRNIFDLFILKRNKSKWINWIYVKISSSWIYWAITCFSAIEIKKVQWRTVGMNNEKKGKYIYIYVERETEREIDVYCAYFFQANNKRAIVNVWLNVRYDRSTDGCLLWKHFFSISLSTFPLSRMWDNCRE